MLRRAVLCVWKASENIEPEQIQFERTASIHGQKICFFYISGLNITKLSNTECLININNSKLICNIIFKFQNYHSLIRGAFKTTYSLIAQFLTVYT